MIGLVAWVWLGCLENVSCAGQDVYGANTAPKSSVTASIKQGFNKVGEFFTPKSNTEQSSSIDAVSLKSPAKPGPQLYSAIAGLYEESGKHAEAEQYYQMALKEKADDLSSLLGYARLQENQGRFNEAVSLYQRAVQTHPKESICYNNLGLCYAKRGKLKEATDAMGQAAQLDPRNQLYRNNLATVLVDQNRLTDAFANLREVHGDAVAYYNMGYLLNKKGQTEAAEHHFAQSLRIDPTMAPAQRWLNYMHNKARESGTTGQPSDGSLRVSSLSNPANFPARATSPPVTQPSDPITSTKSNQTATPSSNTQPRLPVSGSGATVPSNTGTGSKATAQADTPPLPPAINLPKRLPPVTLRQPTGLTDPVKQTSPSTTPATTAPLPPVMR